MGRVIRLRKDITGKTFGSWTVLYFSRNSSSNNKYWMCRCICGNIKEVAYSSLTDGQSKSCGCLSRQAARNTCLDKYGVDHPQKDAGIREKTRNECLAKYGVDTTLKLALVQDKIKATNMERYGVDNPLKSPEIRNKAEETNLARYGNKNPLGCREIQDKIKETNLKNLGVENPAQSEIVRKKTEQTCIERFGAKTPMQSKEVQDKSKRTDMLKYGCEYHISSVDVREKIERTCMSRYGVTVPCKNHDIATKSARNQTRSIKLTHWLTGGEIVCVGSYEVKVVEYLNANRIEYLWQPQTFKMPSNDNGRAKTYRPDLYLADQDTWVEIKGYFRKDAQEKWEWFHSNYTNSELWDKSKLKELGIL